MMSDMSDRQVAGPAGARGLIDALKNAAAYPHRVEAIEVLETHISWVILTGEFAYKIKKPVDLGFVDFSTLERRRFFCQEELKLNARLAPDLYLEQVPITGTPTAAHVGGAGELMAPHVGGAGEPIEWSVRMRQFSQDQLLSRLISAGRLTPAHLDCLARQIAEFHARIPVADPTSRFGTPAAVADPILANFDHLAAPAASAERDLIDRLFAWCQRTLEEHEALLSCRKANGFIRECHGDMHLGNMVLIDERIVIFDCIEFNEDLRWIDVLSEVAFCAMDLADRGRPDLGHRFLNRCLEWSGDYGGLRLFTLYFVYRALVRAKVALLRAAGEHCSPDAGRRLGPEFHNYLALAERATSPPSPFLAITHGLSGSGKTFGSETVVERLGAIRIRSDVERKRLAGLSSCDSSRVDLYAPDFSRRTYEKLAALAADVVASGFAVVVDATFLGRSDRRQFRALADKMRVPFVILDFPTDESTCRRRIEERARRGVDASEATGAVLDQQVRSLEPLSDDERAQVVAVETLVAPPRAS